MINIGSEKEAVAISEKVVYYKEILELRKRLSQRVSFVYDNIFDGIKLDRLAVNYTGFEITARAQNIYDFTKLISNYLRDDYVSEIVLKRANLDTTTKEYDFTIGGVFK
jgi:hypothetical protein